MITYISIILSAIEKSPCLSKVFLNELYWIFKYRLLFGNFFHCILKKIIMQNELAIAITRY